MSVRNPSAKNTPCPTQQLSINRLAMETAAMKPLNSNSEIFQREP
jgi:hypothetical protein